MFFPNKIQLNSPVKCLNRGDPLNIQFLPNKSMIQCMQSKHARPSE